MKTIDRYVVKHYDKNGVQQFGNAYKTKKAAINRYKRFLKKCPHGEIKIIYDDLSELKLHRC